MICRKVDGVYELQHMTGVMSNRIFGGPRGRAHLGRIYGKLGVETRAGAVAVATERRLLS